MQTQVHKHKQKNPTKQQQNQPTNPKPPQTTPQETTSNWR